MHDHHAAHGGGLQSGVACGARVRRGHALHAWLGVTAQSVVQNSVASVVQRGAAQRVLRPALSVRAGSFSAAGRSSLLPSALPASLQLYLLCPITWYSE